jgi:hypothetical protein
MDTTHPQQTWLIVCKAALELWSEIVTLKDFYSTNWATLILTHVESYQLYHVIKILLESTRYLWILSQIKSRDSRIPGFHFFHEYQLGKLNSKCYWKQLPTPPIPRGIFEWGESATESSCQPPQSLGEFLNGVKVLLWKQLPTPPIPRGIFEWGESATLKAVANPPNP